MDERGSGLSLVLLHRVEQAQLRDLERLQLDLDRGGAFAEPRVFGERALLAGHLGGKLLRAADQVLRHAEPRDPGALVPEQELRVVPASVLFAHAAIDRDADIVEEDLVHLVPAVDGDDRPHRHARRLHVDEQHA